MRSRDNRLARVKQAIEESPVRRGVLREAYRWFKDFGDLDDDDHVAYEVVQQALRGGEEQTLEDEAKVAARVRKVGLAYQRREALDDAAWPPSVRALLFDEALYEQPPIRALARSRIAVEVGYGGDVESPGFAARHGIPMYGSVAMHMGGWRKRLTLPPYKFQANRLFARFDNIRGRINVDGPNWLRMQAQAIVRFKETGELPDDDLHIESVLANVELDHLIAHRDGKDVSEVMALLGKVACGDGEEQEEALRGLCAMAAEGRIP